VTAQIASGVQLLAADHPREPELRAAGLELGRPVVVEEDVWLGAGVIVCPGVTLGRDSIVGAGSVVTRDVPAGVVPEPLSRRSRALRMGPCARYPTSPTCQAAWDSWTGQATSSR